MAGLTTARQMREKVGDRAEITVADRMPHLTSIPNLPSEVWNDNNQAVARHLPILRFLEKDGGSLEARARDHHPERKPHGAVANPSPL